MAAQSPPPPGGARGQPFFMQTPAGRLFALHTMPPADRPCRGQVLYVPPFNEEMNRCRSMATLQAQSLAAAGFGTLVVDLLGTGDSEGHYVDGRWDLWLDNLAAAVDWLRQQPGGCVALWGVRLGAILAAQLHARLADPALRLVFWQPVPDGKVHLNQFMRVKIAAQMDRADLPKLTTAQMRDDWNAGRSVEIAGYEIHPDLAAGIEAASLGALSLPAGTALYWLEQAAGEQPELAPASRKLLAQWPGDAVQVQTALFEGPPFWQVHERAVAPDAVQRTTAWLQQTGTAA
jgi:exosortase A-associated hydrolase 2